MTDPALVPPAPAYGRRSLADVLPSLASALGVPGFEDLLGVGVARSTLLLLVDGLGADLLAEHADVAPTLTALTAGRTLDAGFPASTPISVASLGTGLPPGAHGLIGLTMQHGGQVLDTLKWTVDGKDATPQAVPEQVQSRTTVFERVREAGRLPFVVSYAAFRKSSLTRAALRGADYRPTIAHGDCVAASLDAVRTDGAFVYAYVSELDAVGHVHGPGSPAWRFQLREIDRLVEMIANGLPPSSAFAVTGDHGMVRMEGADVLDYDTRPELQNGVALIAGEPRVRYLHLQPGALHDVRETWRAVLGPGFWIGTRDEIIATGSYGPVSAEVADRIGDLVVVAGSTGGILRRTTEPQISWLVGQHGSWTDAERRVALALRTAA